MRQMMLQLPDACVKLNYPYTRNTPLKPCNATMSSGQHKDNLQRVLAHRQTTNNQAISQPAGRPGPWAGDALDLCAHGQAPRGGDKVTVPVGAGRE